MAKPLVVIIANGEAVRQQVFNKFFRESSIVIAADGGANQCQSLGITPDYLIGDFDSMERSVQTRFDEAKILHSPEQNTTDMEKALQFALELNPSCLLIFSAFGKRTDHSAGNLIIFQNLKTQTPIEIIDNHGRMLVLRPGDHDIKSLPGQTVSLFSFEAIDSLVLKGFRYIAEQTKSRSFFIGISNVYESDKCRISFERGVLFLYEVFQA